MQVSVSAHVYTFACLCISACRRFFLFTFQSSNNRVILKEKRIWTGLFLFREVKLLVAPSVSKIVLWAKNAQKCSFLRFQKWMERSFVAGWFVLFTNHFHQGSKNLFSITRQGGSKRKVLVAKVAVKLKFQSPNRQMQRNALLVCLRRGCLIDWLI